MKTIFTVLLFIFLGFPSSALAESSNQYKLYKNHENYGIVVFPKKLIFKDLENYLFSIPFESTESGKAVMRHGTKNENATYMMPLEVQNKHSIEKFIVIQVLDSMSMLVGIYDPEWGLTLPSTIVEMETIKQNIPKTLNIFRGSNRQRQAYYIPPKMSSNPNFSSTLEYNIMHSRRTYSN